MQNIDIARGLVFKKMHIGKDNFEQRLVSQKKVYLLKSLGVELGFSFNWYIHGPYSPRLTTYLYDNLEILSTFDYDNYELDNDVINKLNQINSIQEHKLDTMSESSWYELVASITYLYKQNNIAGDGLFNLLRKYKPQFNKNEFDGAIECLKSLKIIESSES